MARPSIRRASRPGSRTCPASRSRCRAPRLTPPACSPPRSPTRGRWYSSRTNPCTSAASGSTDRRTAVPLGSARIVRPGRDVTVVALSRLVAEAIAAAEELSADGIEVEVIDPRTLVPLDVDTILESVGRTHRLVVAHEAVVHGGFGAEIAAVVQAAAFDELDAPIARVGAPFTPGPVQPAARGRLRSGSCRRRRRRSCDARQAFVSAREDVARLIVACPDRPGIIATLSKLLAENGANIISSDQYSTDPEGGRFFLRMEFHLGRARRAESGGRGAARHRRGRLRDEVAPDPCRGAATRRAVRFTARPLRARPALALAARRAGRGDRRRRLESSGSREARPPVRRPVSPRPGRSRTQGGGGAAVARPACRSGRPRRARAVHADPQRRTSCAGSAPR